MSCGSKPRIMVEKQVMIKAIKDNSDNNDLAIVILKPTTRNILKKPQTKITKLNFFPCWALFSPKSETQYFLKEKPFCLKAEKNTNTLKKMIANKSRIIIIDKKIFTN